MFTFLLIVQTVVAAALVSVILMQRSEGGGLTGGSPSGLMTARGAADFLTRATAILAGLFIILSIALAGLAAIERAPTSIDPSLAKQPVQGSAPPVGAIPGLAPPAADPLAGAAAAAGDQGSPNVAGPGASAPQAPAAGNSQ